VARAGVFLLNSGIVAISRHLNMDPSSYDLYEQEVISVNVCVVLRADVCQNSGCLY